jgi:hypothetical protein
VIKELVNESLASGPILVRHAMAHQNQPPGIGPTDFRDFRRFAWIGPNSGECPSYLPREGGRLRGEMTKRHTPCVTLLQEFSERADFCSPGHPFQRTRRRPARQDDGAAGIKPKPKVIVAYYNYQVKEFFWPRMTLNVNLCGVTPLAPHLSRRQLKFIAKKVD